VQLSLDDSSQTIDARIFDISAGGVALLSPKPFLTAERLRLTIKAPNSIAEKVLLGNPMVFHVQVIWCKELLDINHVGARFLYISPLVQSAMEQAFEKFTRQHVKQKNADD
jgi:c-di-GMP-binding flagellar brake protein YcgR